MAIEEMPVIWPAIRDSNAAQGRRESIDVFESSLCQRFAHFIEVKTKHARRKLGTLRYFIRFASSSGVGNLLHPRGRHHYNTIVISYNCIARLY